MKWFWLFAIVIPVSLPGQTVLPGKPFIYIEGKAEMEKTADTVLLSFGVVARNADAASANKEVQAKAGQVLQLLDTNKIAEKDVVAIQLKSDPQFEKTTDGGSNEGKVVGYRVDRPFEVRVRDVRILPKLVDDLFAIGDVEFGTINAELSDKKQLQEQMWNKAIADAREKAEKTLKSAGMKIDSLYAMSPVNFTQIESELFNSQNPVLSLNRDLIVDPRQYRLPQITVSQSIHVIYLISPAK